MAERGKGRSAVRGAWAGLAVLMGVFQAACHHHRGGPDNTVQAPEVSYRTPAILATAGQPFTSVAPDVSAYVHYTGVGTIVTTGFTFTVSPDLPAGLSLDRNTGLISGTPQEVSPAMVYTVAASDSGGTNYCSVSLGVQAASPVTLSYGDLPSAAAGAVGSNLVLGPPPAADGTGTGFGVSPALPAGLALNSATGLVSGTPTTALAGSPFTLTYTTPGGSANTTFTLLVAAAEGDAPAGLAYPALAATAGEPFAGPVPTLAAGADVVYNVTPALPAGLAMDPLTGQVTGTPAAASAQADYIFTASNAKGSTAAKVKLTIQ